MDSISGLSSIPVGRHISAVELEEISKEIGLDDRDTAIMCEILEKWQPTYDLDYLVEVVDRRKGLRSEKSAAAAFAIAIRATTNFRLSGS